MPAAPALASKLFPAPPRADVEDADGELPLSMISTRRMIITHSLAAARCCMRLYHYFTPMMHFSTADASKDLARGFGHYRKEQSDALFNFMPLLAHMQAKSAYLIYYDV